MSFCAQQFCIYCIVFHSAHYKKEKNAMVGILNTKASDSSEIGSDFREYFSYFNNTRFE